MSSEQRVVSVRFTPGTYFFVLSSFLFVAISFYRYGHVFWWVYLLGGLIGLAVIPILFFLHAMRAEYEVHHEVYSLENTFFDETTEGTMGFEVEDPDSLSAHVERNKRLGEMTFQEWLHTAFDEGIGHTKLTFKDSVLPVIGQSAVFSVILGMMVANVLLVLFIIFDAYVLN